VPTVSIVGHELLHVPPGGVPERVIVPPVITTVGPEIVGRGLTVIILKAGNPPPKRKYVMVSTPGETAKSTPVTESIVATPGLMLNHEPPAHPGPDIVYV